MSLKIFTRHYYGDKIKENKKEWVRRGTHGKIKILYKGLVLKY